MMKKTIMKTAPVLCLVVVLALSAGCATTVKTTIGTGIIPDIPSYSGPKARIAVSRFDYKAAKGGLEVGDGLATMLTTELVNSGRFIVLERENLQDVLAEQDLGGSGRVSEETRAPIGEITGAELLVIGAVTSFEPEKLGLGGALLGGATILGSAILHAKDSNIPIVGAGYVESYLAIDVRLIDTGTSRVLASLTVEGKAADLGGGVLGEVGGGKTLMPMAFGGWQKTSVEKAMRIAIARAVEGIVGNMPGEYYRHASNVYQEGELLGYSYLDFPSDSRPLSTAREAVQVTSSEELDTLLKRWGLQATTAAGQVDFHQEILIAVSAGQEDRGSSLGIQKIVNDAAYLRVEIAVFPSPEEIKETTEKQPAIPFLFARVARTDKPIKAAWFVARRENAE